MAYTSNRIVSMAVEEVTKGAIGLEDHLKLADHLPEFAFAFPLRNEINEASTLLPTYAQIGKQSALVQASRQRCEWVIAASSRSADDTTLGLRALCDAARDCEGVEVGDDMKTIIYEAFQTCEKSAWGLDSIGAPQQFGDAMTHLLKVFPRDDKLQEIPS